MLGTQQVDKIMLGATEVWSAQCKLLYNINESAGKLQSVDIFSGALVNEINYVEDSLEQEGTAVVGRKVMFRVQYNGFNKRDVATGAILASGGIAWGSSANLRGTLSGLYSSFRANSAYGLYKLDQSTMAAIETGPSFGRYLSTGGGTKTYLLVLLSDTGDDPSLLKKYTLDPLVAIADIGIIPHVGVTNYVAAIGRNNQITIYDDATVAVAGSSTAGVSVSTSSAWKDGGK